MVWKWRVSTASASFLPCVKPQPPISSEVAATRATAKMYGGEVFMRVNDGEPEVSYPTGWRRQGWIREEAWSPPCRIRYCWTEPRQHDRGVAMALREKYSRQLPHWAHHVSRKRLWLSSDWD